MTEQGAAERRTLLRPRVAVPAALAALLLAGGSVWALSGGGSGAAPVGAGTPSAAVSPTVQLSPTAAPTPTPTPTLTPAPAEVPASPSPTAEPTATPEPDEPGTAAPAAPRRPATKGAAAPAAPAGAAGAAGAAKPKAPAAPARQDPHDMAPVPCTDCRTEPQPGSGDCYPRGEAKVMVCGPIQTPTPILRPGQSIGTPTPGWPNHTH
ncbi:hypothetical protein ACFV1W_16665 [Kitasatospora sp. NPDC059648]|uniref:hypothetical protein n=1 Tax=Kitasatospora sp. NPDC059648 TaxID=3346894 RepID=UPI0036CB4861